MARQDQDRWIDRKKDPIPTDGSENTANAIAQGLALAKVFGAEVTALSVVDQIVASRSKANEGVEPSSLEACRQATEFIASEGRKLGMTVISLILTGAPIRRDRQGIHRL